ncbi:MAG: class I SAM-dependent methyltransferase [Pseudomonadota bacterium]
MSREGPGNPSMTKRAYGLCEGLPGNAAILELGCGSGGATMALATLTEGTVTATDIHQPYLDSLMKKARQQGVSDRIEAIKMDMADLNFPRESFDLIWCEGAAYIMGLDNALNYWMGFLKPCGYVAISELVWLSAKARESAPEELKAYWAENYPSMRLPEENATIAERAGHSAVGHFTIDTSCWDLFYLDLEQRIADAGPLLLEDHGGNALIDAARKEIEIYRTYPGVYGYEFYVFRK